MTLAHRNFSSLMRSKALSLDDHIIMERELIEFFEEEIDELKKVLRDVEGTQTQVSRQLLILDCLVRIGLKAKIAAEDLKLVPIEPNDKVSLAEHLIHGLLLKVEQGPAVQLGGSPQYKIQVTDDEIDIMRSLAP